MATRLVTVRILHPDPGPSAGPIERWVASARIDLAKRHRSGFFRAGAADVGIVSGPLDDTPFGARLRTLVRADRPAGLVVLGSGAVPLATDRDYRELVEVATSDGRVALANNRFSADVVAISCAEALMDLPDLPGDNALPRWLAEVAGVTVTDMRRRWRLAIDVDGPLDLLLLGGGRPAGTIDVSTLRSRMAALRAVAANPRAELVMSGRTSTPTLTWLERGIKARVRAIVEERGLRASSPLALGPSGAAARDGRAAADETQDDAWAPPDRVAALPARSLASPRSRPAAEARPPSSLLGALLDRDGAGALGDVLARLGEGAIVDTRVLLAHRLGADETAWPKPEDRFASDLLLPDRVRDGWLRELTASAVAAPIPILLGGHSLVGPGVRLLLGGRRLAAAPWR